MGYSYSKVSTWCNCPYHYKLAYIDKLEVKPDLKPNNALFLGTAIHEAIERRDIAAGVESYIDNYPELTEAHEMEIYKLKKAAAKAIESVPEGEYEYKLLDDDGFVGFIDNLVKVEDGVYDIYDFKHSNDVNKYRNSGQIHIYKYFFEKLTGNKVRDIYYVMIPKVKEVLNEEYTQEKLTEKIDKFYDKHDVTFEKIDYDEEKVKYFLESKDKMFKDTKFEKYYTVSCRWCDYAKFCRTNGKDRSELLESEPTEIVEEEKLF